MEMKIILSFDTEFSIGGAFDNSLNKPKSHEVFEPQGEFSHVGFREVLNVLKKNEVRSTFFIEALQTHYFSKEEMGKYIDMLVNEQHDIQLHCHPCWEHFANPNWKETLETTPKDNYEGRGLAEIVNSLQFALKTFEQWGVPKPTAFRAGNLMASTELYKALKQCGISLASNIGLPYFRPKDKALQIENCIKNINGVIELPITSFTRFTGRKKILTITGCSTQEIRSVLKDCNANGVEYVVILTHAHEFIKKKNRNRVGLTRLDNVCKLVNEHEQYSFSCFGDISTNDLSTTASINSIKSNWLAGAFTIIENQLNDKLSFY